MTEQEIADICDKLAEGKSLRSICREIGKAESSVRYWLSKDADAFAHSARARELGCDALADECLEIADGSGDPADKRIRIDTRIRLIGKWSQRYSDKLATAYPVPGTWSAVPFPSSIGLYQPGQGYPKFDQKKADEYYRKVTDKVAALIRDTIAKWDEAGL